MALVALDVWTVRSSREQLDREEQARASATAELGAVFVEQEMGRLSDLVESYAQRRLVVDALAGGSTEALAPHLTQLKEAGHGVSLAFAVDDDGVLLDILPATPSIIGTDFSHRDWYRGVTETHEPYVSEAYETAATGHARVVAAAAEVTDDAGRRLGVLVAAYDLDVIQGHVEGFATSQGVALSVTDQRGVLVTAPGADRRGLVSQADHPGVAAALEGRATVTRRGGRAGGVTVASAPVPELGWTVTASVQAPTSGGLAALRSAMRAVAGVLVAVVLAGSLVLRRSRQRRRVAEHLLAASEVRAGQLLAAAGEGIVGLDLAGIVVFANPAAAAMVGRGADTLVGDVFHAAVDTRRADGPRYPWGDCGALAARQGTAAPVEGEVFRRSDGSTFPVSYVATGISDTEGRPEGAVVTFRDETKRRLAEEALVRSEMRFRSVAQAAVDAIVGVDAEGTVVSWNPGAESIFGYTDQELLGQPVAILFAPGETKAHRGHLAIFKEPVDATLTGTRFEARGLRRDGSAFPLEVSVGSWMSAEGRVYTGILRDVTDRKRSEEQAAQGAAEMAHRALHDGLTQLPNRALLMDRLESAMARAERDGGEVAVLMLDLDGFKVVNDSMGHTTGDALLVDVAQRLRRVVRDTDTVARLGGDEFAIVLDDERHAGALAERILDELLTPSVIQSRMVFVRASIGIATGDRALTGEELLRNADLAMYRAKSDGKGRYRRFEPGMHMAVLERLQLEADLRTAIERRQLVLHYQPIVSLRTGCVVGVEALVRWCHPERGLIGPDQFIDLAEDTGLVVPLGRWVLLTACAQLAAWRSAGLDLTVAVNLSVRQIESPDVVDTVAEALAASGVSADQLVLEVTESVLMDDTARSSATLVALRDMGVKLSIDDFGTGYSSLAQLRRLPVGVLKVDRSFVHELDGPADDVHMVTAIVTMAHNLGLLVVAEGAETHEQLRTLRDLGCDEVQGYAVSPPLPVDRATALLMDGALGLHHVLGPGRASTAVPTTP